MDNSVFIINDTLKMIVKHHLSNIQATVSPEGVGSNPTSDTDWVGVAQCLRL